MPSLTVRPGLTYFYTDSGAPSNANYKTMIIFHGHTFHSGTFQKLNPVASTKGLRLICPNRREYPGSTPFTREEIKTLNEGSEAERAGMIARQGAECALFVDGIVGELALPKEANVILAAWSLGDTFLLSLMASITSLPLEIQERLRVHLAGILLWDPPSQLIGVTEPEECYHPLIDESLSPEARSEVFGVWAASYWNHGDLSTRDISQLSDREPGTEKIASTLAMSPEEIAAIADFAPGEKWETETCGMSYRDILLRLTKKALFDPEVVAARNNAPVWVMYGDASPWNIIYGAWVVEGWQREYLEEKSNETFINFKLVNGANHFFMWDDPQRAMDCLRQCISMGTEHQSCVR